MKTYNGRFSSILELSHCGINVYPEGLPSLAVVALAIPEPNIYLYIYIYIYIYLYMEVNFLLLFGTNGLIWVETLAAVLLRPRMGCHT